MSLGKDVLVEPQLVLYFFVLCEELDEIEIPICVEILHGMETLEVIAVLIGAILLLLFLESLNEVCRCLRSERCINL